MSEDKKYPKCFELSPATKEESDPHRYCVISDEEAIDAIANEVLAGAVDGRCNAGWAMLRRLNGLRKALAEAKKEKLSDVEDLKHE